MLPTEKAELSRHVDAELRNTPLRLMRLLVFQLMPYGGAEVTASQATMAGMLDADRGTVGEACRKLERERWIARTPGAYRRVIEDDGAIGIRSEPDTIHINTAAERCRLLTEDSAAEAAERAEQEAEIELVTVRLSAENPPTRVDSKIQEDSFCLPLPPVLGSACILASLASAEAAQQAARAQRKTRKQQGTGESHAEAEGDRLMRNLHEIDPQYRITDPEMLAQISAGWAGDDTCGVFVVPSATDRQPLVIIVAADKGWDHVSVSRKNRVPNWAEMSYIYRLFFRPDEVAMQLHMPPDQHINLHPFVLHLWAPHDRNIPLPPRSFV